MRAKFIVFSFGLFFAEWNIVFVLCGKFVKTWVGETEIFMTMWLNLKLWPIFICMTVYYTMYETAVDTVIPEPYPHT